LLDITTSYESMNVSEAIRLLSRHLAFNLCKFGLFSFFGIELKPAVGLKFTVELGWVLWVELSCVGYTT